MTLYSQNFDDETPGNAPAGWTRLAGPTGWNAVVLANPYCHTPPNCLNFPYWSLSGTSCYYGRLNTVAPTERFSAYLWMDLVSAGRLGISTSTQNSSSTAYMVTRVYIEASGGLYALKAYNGLSVVTLGTVFSVWNKISIKHYPSESKYEVYLNDVLMTPSKLNYYHAGTPQALLLYFVTQPYVNAFEMDDISVTSDALPASGLLTDCSVRDTRLVV